MADKSIFELTLQTTFASNDRLVVGNYANSDAEAITGQTLVNLLATSLDGHGGIQSIVKTSSTGTDPVIDTYTITMADTSTTTITVTNGLKGDQGLQTFVYFRWAHVQPSSWSDTTSQPDEWMGVYAGTATTPPTTVSAYSWVRVRGDTGETGEAASITSQTVTYMESTSGTIVPSGSWSANVPSVTPGNFLWTRTQLTFNDGSTVTSYSVSRYGIDGTGAVSSVNGQSPDGNGNVALTATNVPTSDNQSIQAHITAAEDDIDTLQSDMTTAQATLGNVQTVAKKALTGKRAYIIGDSLNIRNDGYGQYVLSISGMVGQSVGNNASGFVKQGENNKVFSTVLSELTSSLSTETKNSTDYLVVMGGINDALNDITAANEKTAVESFITSAKTAFPNAEIIICPLHTFKWLKPSQYDCYAAIIDACHENGVKTTEDFLWWTIVDDYGINNGDDVHITGTGCEILGGLIVNFIMGGEVLRTWAYKATTSVGTLFSNALTRKGRDFFWRVIVTSLSSSIPSYSTLTIASIDSSDVAKGMCWQNSTFFNGIIYTSGYCYPAAFNVAPYSSSGGVKLIAYNMPDTPANITGMSAWCNGSWKVGIDEAPTT